jgi:hypothetical protein
MVTFLLVSWVVLIGISYKAIVFVLEKTDNM